MEQVKCRACGSLLETRDVQMRSADEAHTSITSCPSCPVNPNKIDSDTMPAVPLRGIARRVRRSYTPATRTSCNPRPVHIVSIDIPSSHPLMSTELKLRHLVQYSQFHNKRGSDITSNRIVSAYSVISGPLEGRCISLRGDHSIGMGVTVSTYDMLSLHEDMGNRSVIEGMYNEWEEICKYKSYIYCKYGDKSRKIIVELGYDLPSNSILSNIVESVYEKGLAPDAISRYVSSNTIAVFGNLSPRGWDASVPPTHGHSFTCKPDGQNMWLLWVGNIWYKFTPRCRGGAREWIWSDSNNDHDIVAISVEDMGSHGCIVIDCFTDIYGNIASSSRNIEWVVQIARSILSMNSCLPMLIRSYFRDYESAVEYSNALPYPVDGVVAIRDGSTEILKVKPLKSMELMLTEKHTLATADGLDVIPCPEQVVRSFKPGAILEVRFTAPNSGSVSIVDIFERTDKDVANSSDAVSNIIRSACRLLTPDDNERRIALLWCNSIRKSLHTMMHSVESKKTIVVDIGTGTGQSLDSIPNSDSVSHVFIEPDINRCESIARRLRTRRIISDPAELIPAVKSLKTRAVKSIIVNCSLSDILERGRVSDILFGETRAIMCTFSMQFIVKELHYILLSYHVPIYGCGYVYDDVKSDGTLVNSCGVLMKTVNNDTSIIKWGGDQQYEEPVTVFKDYAGIGTIIPGSEMIELPDRALAEGAANICKHVAVIVP
jgi:hypothetical protein